MKHLKVVSSLRPARAQLEFALEAVGLVQAILSVPGIILSLASQSGTVLVQMSEIFGFEVPQKEWHD